MARTRGRRGNYRPQRRKFIWVRRFGQLEVASATVNGLDLLEDFRNTPGATHLGATVMRVRGYIQPLAPGGTGRLGGVIGLRIDSTLMDPTLPANAPTGVAEEDWMAWLPYQRDSQDNPVNASWNSQANSWAVDIKANRRVEELDQTLWMISSPAGTFDIEYQFNLSIGLKLA